jgi:hypothetical protein
LEKEVELSRPFSWATSGVVATLLRLITPDPDRLPIWIWIVATSLIDELLVTAMKFGEVVVGRDVVVFQKRIPRLISLYARPRPSKKRTGEKVEKRMVIKRQKFREFLWVWLIGGISLIS